MRQVGEARFGIAALLALQLLTSVAGVALLARMSPAVERILQENVYSTEAVEAMLAAVALEDPAGFETALLRAETNITEPEEPPLISAIRRDAPAAVAGSGKARTEIVANLRTLGEVNRGSMRRADRRAALLGLAGAWAMALLGFAGFLVSLGVYRRVEARLILPITEVDDVLAKVRSGDEFRRCSRSGDASRRDRLAENLNWLLDRRSVPEPVAAPASTHPVLLALLDRLERPAWVVGTQGVVLAANRTALALPDASPWTPPEGVIDGAPPAGWEVTPVGELRLVEGLAPNPAPSAR